MEYIFHFDIGRNIFVLHLYYVVSTIYSFRRFVSFDNSSVAAAFSRSRANGFDLIYRHLFPTIRPYLSLTNIIYNIVLC